MNFTPLPRKTGIKCFFSDTSARKSMIYRVDLEKEHRCLHTCLCHPRERRVCSLPGLQKHSSESAPDSAPLCPPGIRPGALLPLAEVGSGPSAEIPGLLPQTLKWDDCIPTVANCQESVYPTAEVQSVKTGVWRSRDRRAAGPKQDDESSKDITANITQLFYCLRRLILNLLITYHVAAKCRLMALFHKFEKISTNTQFCSTASSTKIQFLNSPDLHAVCSQTTGFRWWLFHFAF